MSLPVEVIFDGVSADGSRRVRLAVVPALARPNEPICERLKLLVRGPDLRAPQTEIFGVLDPGVEVILSQPPAGGMRLWWSAGGCCGVAMNSV